MKRTLPAAWPWLALALVSLLALGNAWRYGSWIANPLVHTDSWYFVDVFVEPWAEGSLDWQDFFLKRDSSDHAQPLHRASLWLNLEWADLDFRIEAVFGLLGLSLCMLLLCLLAWLHLRRRAHAEASALAISVPLLLLPLMALSLNSHEIYYWSLVNFFHVSLFPALVLMAFVCWQLGDGAPATLRWQLPLALVLSLLVQVALDGAGLLAVAALLPVLVWAGWRHGQWRRAAAFAAAIVVGLVLYRVLYSALMPPVPPSQAGGLVPALTWLAQHSSEAWRWLLLPAAASIVQPLHLPFWLPEGGVAPVQHGLGVLVLIAHGAFWWSQLRERRPAPLSLFAAALLLLSYGMLAGILLSRLPVYGTDYLLQSRYVAFYQLANLALLLQLLVVLARRPKPRGAAVAALAMLFVAGLGLQVLLADRAWEQGAHIRHYSREMASNLVCLGAHPSQQAPVCQAGNVICQSGPEHRDRLFGLLQARQLNLYAPGFLERHGLAEGLNPDSCLVAP